MKFLQGTLFTRPRTPMILTIIAVVVVVGAGLGLRQPSAEAQDGGSIQYGEAKLGVVSSPNGVIYQFEGGAGDGVEVELLGIGGFKPTVTIYSADGSVVAQNENDNNTNVISLGATLPDTGTYTIQVRGRDGTNGQFTISLQGTPAANGGGTGGGPDGVAGSDGAVPIIGQVSPDNPEETYLITLDPDGFIKVTVRSLTPGYTPVVRLEDADGNVVALFNGQFLSGITIELPPGNGNLTLVVGLGNFNDVAEFGLSTTAGLVDECVVVTDVEPGFEMRTGPTTDHPVTGLVDAGVEVTPTGQSNGWYQIAVGDSYRWIDGQIATTEGLCAFLPEADYPAPDAEPDTGPIETEEAGPDGTPSHTSTPSYTPTDGPSPTNTRTATTGPSPTRTSTQVGPTATYTPSYTTTFTPSYTATFTPSYTHTFTPSYTPTAPPPQTAPPDANYNLDVPLDSTGSVLDFVSYPDGDREDRVFFSVTGMNPNSSLSGGQARQVIGVTCFGNNTDQVTFFTGGQTYSCGQTIVDRNITADSDTGSILITAVGGQGTYIQWVVTMTATRTN